MNKHNHDPNNSTDGINDCDDNDCEDMRITSLSSCYNTPSPTKTVATSTSTNTNSLASSSPYSLSRHHLEKEKDGVMDDGYYDNVRKRLPFYTYDIDDHDVVDAKSRRSRRKIMLSYSILIVLFVVIAVVVAIMMTHQQWFASRDEKSTIDNDHDINDNDKGVNYDDEDAEVLGNDVNYECERTDDCLFGLTCAYTTGRGEKFKSKRKLCCSDTIDLDVDMEGNYELYCAKQPVGSGCRSDEICLSGVCVEKECLTNKLESNSACDSVSDCLSGFCGYASFSDEARTVCCLSEDASIYFEGSLYCTNMNSGAMCGTDEMCSSGNCSLEYPSNSKQVCCNSKRSEDIGNNQYCSGKSLGDMCGTHKMCLSGYCVNQTCVNDLLLPEMNCAGSFECQNGICAQTSLTSEQTICCPGGESISTVYESSIVEVCIGQDNGNACTIDEMCLSQSCGMSNYTEYAQQVCCTHENAGPFLLPGSSKNTKAMFCSNFDNGELCGSNEMCMSNVCLFGICIAGSGDSDSICDENDDCINQACAKETYRSKSKYVCCSSNAYITTLLHSEEYNFCTGQSNGSPCGTNEICDSQYCDNGVCRSKNALIGEQCLNNSECVSGNCSERCIPSESCKALKSNGIPSESDFLNIVFIGSGFTDRIFLEERIRHIFNSLQQFELFGSSNTQFEAFYVDALHSSFCSYDCSDTHSSLLCCDIPTAQTIAKDCFSPSSNHYTLIVENNVEYGGAAYFSSNIATTSINEQYGHLVAFHELGHIMFELGDEYTTSTSTAEASPNCDVIGCPKFADLVDRFENVTCEVKGCSNGDYFLGGLTNMNWIEYPFGEVNLRYACCTFLLFTSQLPSYCDRFEFSPNYLFEYCSKNYQGYMYLDDNVQRNLNINQDISKIHSKHIHIRRPVEIITFNTTKGTIIDRSRSRGLTLSASVILGDFLERPSNSAYYEITLYYEHGTRHLFYQEYFAIHSPPLNIGYSDNEFQQPSLIQRRDLITIVVDVLNSNSLGKFLDGSLEYKKSLENPIIAIGN